MVKKIVKKWGDSLVVVFNREDCQIYGIVEGSFLDLSELRVLDDSVFKLDQADHNITKICEEMRENDKA